jgi:hypothetical protein
MPVAPGLAARLGGPGPPSAAGVGLRCGAAVRAVPGRLFDGDVATLTLVVDESTGLERGWSAADPRSSSTTTGRARAGLPG